MPTANSETEGANRNQSSHPNHQGGEMETEKGTTTEAATSQGTTTSLGTLLGTLLGLNLREDQAW